MNEATILVVDDSATKRYLLVSWLTRAGFTVVEAETGGEALAKLGEAEIDLVVLDVKLPDMSGFDVCEQIKSDAEYGILPVIHVSAHAVDVVDRTQGLNRGADAYLVEPIEPDELIATAQAVLRYYRARQRAETLAARMVRLAETTLAINSASTLAGLLRAAADGAHEIFEGPVVVLAESSDGDSLAAAGAPPVVRPWSLDERNVAVGSLVRTDDPADWNIVDWPAGESVAVAAARLRFDRPPVYVACRAVRRRPASRCSASSPRRSRPRSRRSARTTRSTGSRSCSSAACCNPRAARRCPASISRSGTNRPARRPRWAATSTSSSMIDGKLLVAIGDVAGHSLHAATVMAELRHAVRAYAVEGHPPAAVLELVNGSCVSRCRPTRPRCA